MGRGSRVKSVKLTADQDGYVRVDAMVANPMDPRLKVRVNFIADTGASGCTIPQEIAEKLKLEARGEATIIMADGSTAKASIGSALLEIEGRTLYIYLIYGPGFDALLGIDVMRALDLHVDPRARSILIPIHLLRILNLTS